MNLTRDFRLMLKAFNHGIKIPYVAMKVARQTGVPFYVLCAFLEQETAGGKNIFGHDPTIFVGAGRVTKSKYLRYRRLRDRTGKMQGVGPLQLTYYSFQDDADKLGGCWKPRNSVLVGARLLKRYRGKDNSWVYVGERFNGAHSYGVEVQAKINKWQSLLGV